MIVRVNDAESKIEIIPQGPRDILDLASVLHRLGLGDYRLRFRHPTNNTDKPVIELIQLTRIGPFQEKVDK